jgi:4-amino-4-deoxy-L-arabinose transferase-like glycosyltransferase
MVLFMASRTLNPRAKKRQNHTTGIATPTGNLPWWAPLLAVSIVLFILRAVYVVWFTPYGLAPDEAQYWSWLANPDYSYLTKPPLTTFVIGFSTALFGDTLFGVKFFALLSQSVVPLLGAALARELAPQTHKNQSGLWAFALLTTVPLIAAGGLIMAPDVLLLPLWLGAMLAVVRGLNAPTPARALCWPRWVIMGVLVGLAGLAKYSAVLFFPLLFLFVLGFKREWVKAPQFYLAGLIALALQAPVVYWNATNSWVGLHHLLWQAEGDGRHGGLATLADFVGGQALVLGPLALVLLVCAWAHYARKGRKLPAPIAFVLVMTLPIFIGFMLQTFSAKVQANWPLLATVPALPLVAVYLAQLRWNRLKLMAIMAGLVLSTLLSLALYNTQVLRPILPLKTDPTKDLLGWADMGVLLGGVLQRLENPIVLGVRYQTLAPLAFHTTPKIDWFYWNAEGRRATDYDDWLWPQSLPHRPVVLVKESADFPIHVAELFRECKPWYSLGTEQNTEVVRRLYTWVCWDYRATQGQ